MTGLEKIGFALYAQWVFSPDKDLQINILGKKNERPCLYAFTVNKNVFYIGSTKRSINARLNNYLHSDSSQRTNVRIMQRIREALRDDAVVELMILAPEHRSRQYTDIGFPEALEKHLIQTLQPPWNRQHRQELTTSYTEGRENSDFSTHNAKNTHAWRPVMENNTELTAKEIFVFVTKFNAALGNNPFNTRNGAKDFTSDQDYKDRIEKYIMNKDSVLLFEKTINRHPEAISFEQFVAAVGEKLKFSPECVARSKENLRRFNSSKK
jgi:hypothetical protein